jgi:hypothetical protein
MLDSEIDKIIYEQFGSSLNDSQHFALISIFRKSERSKNQVYELFNKREINTKDYFSMLEEINKTLKSECQNVFMAI